MAVRDAIRRWLDIDVHRVADPSVLQLTRSTLDFELDEAFSSMVSRAVELSGSGPMGVGDGPMRRRQRLYNLVQMVEHTSGVPGTVIECGTYRGLSAYLMCRYLQAENPSFRGEGFHIIDSFEGISQLAAQDRPDDKTIPSGKLRAAGMFSAGTEVVRRTLTEFPYVELHPGWIPESLAKVPEQPVRLAHLDLDLYEPTKAALEVLFPRLSPGGALLCDDFGAIRWPGVTAAVEEFCGSTAAPFLRLSTGQAIVFGCRPTPTAGQVRLA